MLTGCAAHQGASVPFREASAETGLDFHHFTGATGDFYMPEIVGAGVAMIDYDGDGDLDVYLVQGSFINPAKKLADALYPPGKDWKPGNRLFRNDLIPTGKLHFTDVTDQAGVGWVGEGQGVAVGDYNNDGLPDIYVTNFGPNVLYRNNGNGTFTDVTKEAGVEDNQWSTSAAFCDLDGDGKLDLFVAHYVNFPVNGNPRCENDSGERDYCGPKVFRPVPSRLYRNLGNGRFEDVTEKSGITAASAARGWVWLAPISTTTGEWICTSPTTRIPTFSGSIKATFTSRIRHCWRARRTTAKARRSPAWVLQSVMSTTTAVRTFS